MDVLRELDGGANTWFFALANRKPFRAAAAGVCMMLEHGVSKESITAVANKPGLEHFKNQLLRNIPEWRKYAGETGRTLLDNLRQQLTSEPHHKKASV